MSSSEIQRLNAALAGRFAIERELGRGATATVYLAEDVKHHRPVALKVLQQELAAALGASRFLREISIAARLNHPHILALYDSAEAEGFVVYAMPYVQGESLRHRMRREKQLPVEQAVQIAREVASALEYAHGQGVIHRDIKPENILLHEGMAMVADFGIALAVSAASAERMTEGGIVIGTPEYMSPEQAAGEPLDARSDIYSLGCILYEMLAGEPPFTGSTALALMARRIATDAIPVRRLRPGVAPAIEQALVGALARVPADRFPSAALFAAALERSVVTQPRKQSVAVLPFLNMSSDPENDYFADGITEDVIAHLSKVRALEVISRSSVMPFRKRDLGMREIGAQLNVATVLDGSVRRAGNRVRIVAQLIDAETDRHLWSDTYDRELTDIFAIQTDVALKIAAALEAGITQDESSRIRKDPTNDLAAYQLYLQGRHCFIRYTPEGMRKAIEFFEQAIALDPGYALAYVGIANACTELAETGALRPGGAYARAGTCAAKALELDGELGEAHSALAHLKFVVDFDWAGAEQEFKRALELSPGSADVHDLYGRMLSALERYDQSLVALRRARELDPLAHRIDVATALLRAGRYDEVIAETVPVIDLDPNYARARATRGWAYLLKGMTVEGLVDLEKAVSVSPGDTAWLAQLGQAYASVGRIKDARDILRQLEALSRQRYVTPYHMAYIHVGLGDADTAIDWLEQAYEERAGAVYGMKGSFLLASLRAHPRFTALLRKMNLA